MTKQPFPAWILVFFTVFALSVAGVRGVPAYLSMSPTLPAVLQAVTPSGLDCWCYDPFLDTGPHRLSGDGLSLIGIAGIDRAYKVMAEIWQSGTAFYYVMRVQWFTWPGVSNLIYENQYAVVLLTYLTILFELSFPFMLLNRSARWGVILFGVFFHAGIAALMGLMGLIGFSWIMLSLYFVLLTDQEYERIVAVARDVHARVTTSFMPRSDVIVLYDGVCGMCNGFVAFVLARSKALKVAPVQAKVGQQMMAAHGKDGTRLESLYVVVREGASSGRCLERADAVLYVLGALDGAGWRALGLVLRLVPLCVLNALYNAVAANRYRLRGTCDLEAMRRYGDRVLTTHDGVGNRKGGTEWSSDVR